MFQPNPNAESATVPVKQAGPVSVVCVYNVAPLSLNTNMLDLALENETILCKIHT